MRVGLLHGQFVGGRNVKAPVILDNLMNMKTFVISKTPLRSTEVEKFMKYSIS
jgi:hypothetical protein